MTLEERLGLENQILDRDGLSQFQVYYSQEKGLYFLWGEHKTNSGRSYTIWSPIPNRYPYQLPPVYVYRPNPLLGYGGLKTINSYGSSHYMHTFTNGPNGEVQICHWRSDRWHSGITLNKVMLKVVLWLEAYEQHLSTGKDISEFVRTMQEG
ncbi:MAG: hypothetical protein ACFFCW_07700 [Candidatus Hodarchaeota archaeon]